MKRYISILRGINVGGKRKILMKELKELYEDLGFSNITTYIQSGNVIFNCCSECTSVSIENKIQTAILQKFKHDVPVIIRTADELEKSFLNNPFIKTKNFEIEHLYLTFLKDVPSDENLRLINKIEFENDKFEIIGKDIFAYCSGKFSDSKLSIKFFESKLRTMATTRNWKTVSKLHEISTNG
ncbi:DUF1697 domain-containing protein [Bacteroidota bacterium]